MDGFRFYGTFPDAESANDWGDEASVLKDENWWVGTIEEAK